ncbi:FN3 associated domain-containing protein [Desulfatitalea alkaliphila]|uniref:Chitobiase/beta-hexosaminidase C-terminal domain-containing protein n=1 Tax=Desulfatitalea alkaliphila TaxID=2929485 RepID=A0AA41UKA7_9BACT|nr:chitobiase/beta-hexosaminidase C-terminal domain-containing protein [Desulfatitalea alkaliphila]MCJ8500221.1 chitobiase/beta-hexosaminidase C-terminal domain-containing protein [Desulfatitalea alkaliphila]
MLKIKCRTKRSYDVLPILLICLFFGFVVLGCGGGGGGGGGEGAEQFNYSRYGKIDHLNDITLDLVWLDYSQAQISSGRIYGLERRPRVGEYIGLSVLNKDTGKLYYKIDLNTTNLNAFAIHGRYLFAMSSDNEISVFDVSSETNYIKLDSIPLSTCGHVQFMEVKNDLLYIIGTKGLNVVNISDCSNLFVVYSSEIDEAYKTEKEGGVVDARYLVVNHANGVGIYDINSSSDFKMVDYITCSGCRLETDSDRFYINGHYKSPIEIYRLDNSGVARKVGEVKSHIEGIGGFAASNGFLVVGGGIYNSDFGEYSRSYDVILYDVRHSEAPKVYDFLSINKEPHHGQSHQGTSLLFDGFRIWASNGTKITSIYSLVNTTSDLFVAPPEYHPPPGLYSTAQYVSISTATPGAIIRYTADGSIPTITNGFTYRTPIMVNADTVFRAIAYSGHDISEVSTASYSIGNNALHIVTTNSTSGGSVTPSSRSVQQGTVTTFHIMPENGFSIDSVETNCGSGGSWSGNVYTTPVIENSCSVTFVFKKGDIIVTASAGTGGSVSPNSRTVNNGSMTTFTVSPNAGYERGPATTNCGPGGSWSGDTYTTPVITEPCSVSFTFELSTPRQCFVETTSNNLGVYERHAVDCGNTATFSFDANSPLIGAKVITDCGGSGSWVGNIYRSPIITDSLCRIHFLTFEHIDAASAFYQNLILENDGMLWAWGANEGTFGDGTLTDSSTPIEIEGFDGGISVSAGLLHSLVLKSDGTVWAWGRGPLGDGISTNRTTSTVPIQVSELTKASRIAAGFYHSYALENSAVYAWGSNDYGQLGDGTTSSRTVPTRVLFNSQIRSIAAGGYHGLALQFGNVWSWGRNDSGQLGDGTFTNRPTPVQVLDLSGVISIVAGADHSLALKDDGTVWAWGANIYGQLGDGTTNDNAKPVKVQGLNGIVSLSAGGAHSLALKDDGTVWAWGLNNYGQLGDGTTTDRFTPVRVPGLHGIEMIAAGGLHSLARSINSTFWSWGRNNYGQLGDGTTTDRLTPVQVSGFNDGGEGGGEFPLLPESEAHFNVYGYRGIPYTNFINGPPPFEEFELIYNAKQSVDVDIPIDEFTMVWMETNFDYYYAPRPFGYDYIALDDGSGSMNNWYSSNIEGGPSGFLQAVSSKDGQVAYGKILVFPTGNASVLSVKTISSSELD